VVANDDPITFAKYAQEQGLLDTPGWNHFKRILNTKNNQDLFVHQARVGKYKREPFWKFGFLLSRVHSQAIELDKTNGNSKWKDAEETERNQLIEYNTFIDKGVGGEAPVGYKKIHCHIIYDVKHDGRHKARIVSGGHLTDPNTESAYSLCCIIAWNSLDCISC
jgi:hypothetical protein